MSRLPRTLAAGRTGIADWSLDLRIQGTAPDADLSPRLLGEAVDFLVALHGAGDHSAPPASIARDAEVLASVCVRHENGERVRDLGAVLERDLADVPRGFGHGDFWTRNLLVLDGRLAGVIDWDGAGPGRLPLIDLLHLRISAHQERTRRPFARALVDDLLPWARAGGDEVAQAYLSRIGLELDSGRLEQFVLAYWLDRMALEVRRSPTVRGVRSGCGTTSRTSSSRSATCAVVPRTRTSLQPRQRPEVSR